MHQKQILKVFSSNGFSSNNRQQQEVDLTSWVYRAGKGEEVQPASVVIRSPHGTAAPTRYRFWSHWTISTPQTHHFIPLTWKTPALESPLTSATGNTIGNKQATDERNKKKADQLILKPFKTVIWTETIIKSETTTIYHMHFWSCAALDRPFTLLSHRWKISHLCLPHIDSTADLWHAVLWTPSWWDQSPPGRTHIRPKLCSPSGPPSPLQSGLFAIRHASHVVGLLFMIPEHRLTCRHTHTPTCQGSETALCACILSPR